ncbi:non-ribosomal peptide synthetase [Nostoc sp. NZL]|uniref:non-ribosomal peptide synthetase n=1 Tax=Nostoc sp. NZL TaxID=2650612 RepID=UPI0018C68D70|nr:non-ribosomal peptide synthetase [Nostoc sp. NZL]MBG1243505.1 amino acid adenylation domain-containing protein [Nostoc sp. NZL]
MARPFNELCVGEVSLSCSTIVDLLRYRAIHQPDIVAFTFLQDGETLERTLTYQDLDRCSRAIAAQLQALGLSGERALLLYPPGLDYLVAFFGCLYAGVVAIPAYPPRNQRKAPRIEAIVADAQAKTALTTTVLLPTIQSLLADKTNCGNLQWLTTDNLTPGIENSWQEPLININTLAFLQYTSGSTGTPKGVMLGHGNLLHNAATTYQIMEHSPTSKFVSWLPTYHDMGLIGGILQPLYGGFPCILMPPTSFLQRPYRWLQAISRYKGTTSGGPNFAYELCIQKITPEQRSSLDLSSWSVAFNGAEPIRQDTLERFAETFAECGFRKEAFYPCYGMAETTLMVSGSIKTVLPRVKPVEKSALSKNQVIEAIAETEDSQSFVSCGQSIPQQQIIIAHPETLTRCQADEVGEIWVSGPSIGQGYWNRPEETEQTFHAYLKDTQEGPFLRTGDLGFLDNGELFVTGRAKDLIIIRGRNIYPQDIELTTECSHSSLRSGSSAAFSVEVGDEEQLVVVQELEFRAKPNIDEVTAAIRQAVTEEHEVQVYGVVLIKGGTIPKTSSGKIQRRATKADFLAGKLDVIGSSILQSVEVAGKENRLQRAELLALSPRESQPLLESYLIEQVARVLTIAPDEVNPTQPLSSLGLDSLRVFELKNRIEADLEVEISVADFFENLSTRSLSTKILSHLTTTSTSSVSITQIHRTTSAHPLSLAQQQLWFINQLAPNTPAYNIPVVISLTGHVNVAALTQSLNEIIRRHEVLRTNFILDEGKPVQVINTAVKLTLPVEDVTSHDWQPIATEFAQQLFDLSCQLLLCAKLLRLGSQEYKLLLNLHHIIADGWSMGILIRELAELYEAFSHGKPSPLPELPIQYLDFVSWQRQWLHERMQPLLTYWQQQLGGELPILNLPTDRPRRSFASCRQTSPIQTFKGAQAKLILPQTLTTALKKLSHQEGVTLFMTLLTAFKILLYRYTGQTDILVGSPIASRNRSEIDSLMGLFINVLVLRTDLSGEPSYRELLTRVKSTALAGYVHQDMPFEKLVEALQPTRDLSYNPLFQVMFVLQNMPLPTPKLSDISITTEEGYSGTAKFDLTLFIEDREQGLLTTLEYNTDLFNADTMTRMLGHFQTLLEGITANLDSCIVEMPLLTATEKQQLIVDWNNTQINYPLDLCIHQLFEQQVEQTPDAIAVVFENQEITYRELNNRANQLAHYLQKLGVKPEVIVGICMERSLEMAIGLLAILKAGGAYLPLDPSYPKERLALMLTDAQVPVLLVQQHLTQELPPNQAQVVCLDANTQTLINQQTQENPVSKVNSENLAYVIYTSGSTGKPKGVMNTHLGLCNRLLWMQDAYPLTATDRVLQKTPFSFDVSVWEFFWPLFTGARLVVAKPRGHQDTAYLVELIAQQQITTLHFVPSMLQIFLEEPSLNRCNNIIKRVICSGEALPFELQQLFFARLDAELHNLYGPTEASIDVTFWACQLHSNERIVPIGRPIANTQIYILDRYLQPVPVGVPGELHIGGVGLARGYLHQPELTNEKFISSSLELGKRLYKTGDLARYRRDGNIEYLGRIDHQVKIRGFRIELGEIEAVLSQHPQVRETMVLVREDIPNERRLVAYVIPHKNIEISINELRDFLKDKLPEYMVPSAYILLNEFPLTPNGKVDRRALPVPEELRPQLATTYHAPQSHVEKTIAQVWQEVLHLEKVGVNDNFFDLGGHSLLIIQVNNKLRNIFKRELSVVELFQNPTINSLAEYLNQNLEVQDNFDQIRDRVQKQRALLTKQTRRKIQ